MASAFSFFAPLPVTGAGLTGVAVRVGLASEAAGADNGSKSSLRNSFERVGCFSE